MLAVSYGTLLGQAYLAEHPEHVRTMIFDGTLDPTKTGPQYTLDGSLDVTDATQSYGTDRKVSIATGFTEAYRQITDVYPVPGYVQDLAYTCEDFAWPTSPAALDGEFTTEQQADVLSARANCFGWPDADPLSQLLFTDDGPKPLLTNSLSDRRTTIEEAVTVAERTGGTLITMPGTFHGLVGNFSCPTEIAATYLLSGRLPAATECPEPQPIEQ